MKDRSRLSALFLLALRLLWRDHRAGELALVAAAVVLAVASVTTVGFFTDRVHQALTRQANQLLGADLVIVSGRPIDPAFETEAVARGLAVARLLRFPSMAIHGESSALSSVKAVSEGYPLRGALRIADALYGPDRRAQSVPAPGSVWVDERLYAQLGLAIGSALELGRAQFTVAAILIQEPDAAIGIFSSAPRVIFNEADLEKTGLVAPGSRVGYRLQIAGSPEAVDAYRAWLAPRLKAGQRVEGIRDARPQIRAALERAEKFLGLAALVTVVLAAVAIGLAARRFLQRHLDACAILRCLGASGRAVVGMYLVHFAVMGLAASLLGCALGIAAQALLAQWLSGLVAVSLPSPGPAPAIDGVAIGLALLLGFALPPLVSLRRVPTLRVLRRELGAPPAAGIATYLAGYAVIAAMILWKAQNLRLGLIVLGGFTAAIVLAAALTWLLLRFAGQLRSQGLAWRYGVANLQRRTLGTVVQVVALAIGIMALLVLTLVRHDLLYAWRTSLPPDAPNRFIINIQPEQVDQLHAYFAKHGVRAPVLFPMVRGRLVQVNEKTVSAADYVDDRARRLVNREFNLSWATRMQADNRVIAGRWWSEPTPAPQFSVERGIAESLGLKVGDTLTFNIAGSPVAARITSLREVDWDTFNVNFFVIAAPGMLERYPATYVTSFHLPPGNATLLAGLVREFPNFVLIDIAQVLAQVQTMMDQVTRAVQFIFLFTLLAGIVVLYAAIAATQDERLHQAGVMRALGASRAQLTRAILAEFGVLGAIAGLLAATGASALGYIVATHVLNLSYSGNALVWLVGTAAGAFGIAAVGYMGARTVLQAAPLRVLRQVG